MDHRFLQFLERFVSLLERLEADTEDDDPGNGEGEEDAEEEDSMVDLDSCHFIIVWHSTTVSNVRTSFRPEWQTTQDRPAEVSIAGIQQAERFYGMIADEYSPEIWLAMTDTLRVLMHRRGPTVSTDDEETKPFPRRV